MHLVTGAGDLVVVRVGGHSYGVPVAAVVEVTRMVALAPLPDAPPWMAGVADLRGVPVPVVDLAARLGRTAQVPVLDRRIVVAGDPVDPIGLIVDEVTGVAAPGPATGGDASTSPLVTRTVRVGLDMVMVLDEAAFRMAGGRG
ncbi:MAG: chemotaxis protein CheW [Actinobacteria bacterium]|nr:chemotaxis protein CheW [Actinomycetota bacterium]